MTPDSPTGPQIPLAKSGDWTAAPTSPSSHEPVPPSMAPAVENNADEKKTPTIWIPPEEHETHMYPETSMAQQILSRHPLNEEFAKKYRITSELGTGGFGFVCGAIKFDEQKEVAVKFILKSRIPQSAWTRDKDLGMVPMEIFILKNVRHPNIIQFLDFYDDNHYAYLVTELHGSHWNTGQSNPSVCHSETAATTTWARPANSSASERTHPPDSLTSAFSKGVGVGGRIMENHNVKYSSSPTEGLADTCRMTETSNGRVVPVVYRNVPPNLLHGGSSLPLPESVFPADLTAKAAERSSISASPEDPDSSGSSSRSSFSPKHRPNLSRGKTFPLVTRLVRRPSMDLFECIEQQESLSESRSKLVFRQVAQAVKYLHSRGVVHRDIKDENIVVDAEYNVRLIDFGSAAVEPRGNPNHLFDTFHGTIQYASPEILRGERYRGRPTDVWALGVLLYTVLCGEVPFSSSEQAMNAIIKPPKFRSNADALRLILWMLDLDPRRRPTAAQICSHPWLRLDPERGL